METIHNAWAAIPLCWYNALDRRSPRPPLESIAENQEVIRWYAQRDIPVELNEPHHWSLRDSHDALAVAMSYLSAYNAKALGVKHYISQYMFNTPPSTYGAMDLGKMLAKVEMVESLHDDNFVSLRQVRAGLLSLSPDLEMAEGQLAASTVLALGVRPHIIHVVGFCEGDHAATADDVIESCKIVRGVLKNCLFGMPDFTVDEVVQKRKEQLIEEAKILIEGIRQLGADQAEDPLTDPETLAHAIKIGVLDAPHLAGNLYALGALQTAVIDGAIYAIDPKTKKILPERDRISRILGPPRKRLPRK